MVKLELKKGMLNVFLFMLICAIGAAQSPPSSTVETIAEVRDEITAKSQKGHLMSENSASPAVSNDSSGSFEMISLDSFNENENGSLEPIASTLDNPTTTTTTRKPEVTINYTLPANSPLLSCKLRAVRIFGRVHVQIRCPIRYENYTNFFEHFKHNANALLYELDRTEIPGTVGGELLRIILGYRLQEYRNSDQAKIRAKIARMISRKTNSTHMHVHFLNNLVNVHGTCSYCGQTA